jgi:hypothetical protein
MKLRLSGATPIATLILAMTLAPSAPSNAFSPGATDRHMSDAERIHFLDGEFQIIKDTKEFPGSVVKTLCGGLELRSCMANPGETFNASDVVSNHSHIPGRRLIFAGVLGDKYFVHYEQGGIALFRKISFFEMPSSATVTTLWSGYCFGAAANIDELRKRITSGACSH